MNTTFRTIGIAIFLFFSFSSFAQQRDIDTVLARYRRLLLQQPVTETTATHLMQTLNAQGQWADVQYDDTERANWKTSIHLQHIRSLAIIWGQPNTSWYHKREVMAAINAALDHWLQKRYKNSNWWHNQIGVPQIMRDIIILVRDSLTTDRFKQAMEVLAQHQVNGTGANLTWSADLGFHYGALSKDTAMMNHCINLIHQEIRLSDKEGVQPDYSFHQHGNRLMMYSYGEAFLKENVRIAWEVHGTPWEFPAEKTNVLTGFVLEGWQWMARGINTVPGTVDRAVSRVNNLQNADLRSVIPLLIELQPAKAAAFAALNERQNGKGTPLKGFRYFPYSDFTAYQQPDFSFFLKTISTRTLVSESINSENLKGHLLDNGDAYIIKDGNEYFNLMPCWNWEYIPGVTNFSGSDKIIRLPLCGSVTNGVAGASAMDYGLAGKATNQSLTAKKFWACDSNMVFCLIAGLQTTGIDSVPFTALDQCRWQTDVVVNDKNNVIKEGDHLFQKPDWLYHNKTAYIFPTPETIGVHLKTVTGAWIDINKSQPATPVTEKVFLPYIVHDRQRNDFSYIIAYCKDAKEAQQLAHYPMWCREISNTTTLQAVGFNDGSVMAVFWQAGPVEVTKGHVWSVNKPCMIMLSGNRIYASDPSHTGFTLAFSLSGKKYSIDLPADGTSVSVSR